jgi:hypothetical protein
MKYKMKDIREICNAMSSLVEPLMEAVKPDGKFNKQDSWKTLLKIGETEASHLTVIKYKDKVEEFMLSLIDAYEKSGGKRKHPITWANGPVFIKLPYEFTPIIKTVINTNNFSELFTIREKDEKKIYVDYINNGKKVKMIETGRGSVGRVPTDLQESSTCALFNIYMDMIDEDTDDMAQLDDLNNIKNLIIDALGIDGDKFDETWLISFSHQIKSIVKFLKSFDLDVTEYRAVRYGDKKNPVSAAYTNMISAYTKVCGTTGSRKDTYDPSDIILYDQRAIGKIESICRAGSSRDDYEDPNNSDKGIKNEYINELFLSHLCMGISLKKLTGAGRPEIFNTGSHNIVKSVNTIKKDDIIIKPNYITVKVSGNFNFDNTTIDNGEEVNNQKSILITLRSFGSVAMDVKMDAKGEPALGKCPVDIWRSILKVNKRTKLHDCLKAFEKFLKSNNNTDQIQSLIQYAIKEGPHCYPFILLH